MSMRSYEMWDEEDEQRARRLREHLGLDDEAVEVVLHLRRQLIELKQQMRELERVLDGNRGYREMRLARYRMYYEGTWREELDEQDGNS